MRNSRYDPYFKRELENEPTEYTELILSGLSAGCCISTKPRNATDTAILRREMHCKRNRSGSEFAVRLGKPFCSYR
jgi:hypothetical protein